MINNNNIIMPHTSSWKSVENNLQKSLKKIKTSREQQRLQDERTKKVLKGGLAVALIAGTAIISGNAIYNKGLDTSRSVPYTFDVDAQGTKVFEEQIYEDNSLMDIHNHLTRYNELKGRENNLTPDEQKGLEESYNFFKEHYSSERDLRFDLELPLYKSMLISRYNLDIDVSDIQLENHNPDKYEDGYCEITINNVSETIKKPIPILYDIDKGSYHSYFDKNGDFNSKLYLKDLKTIGKELKNAKFPSENNMKKFLGDKYIEPNSQNDLQKFNLEEFKEIHDNLDKEDKITNMSELSDNGIINQIKNNERG